MNSDLSAVHMSPPPEESSIEALTIEGGVHPVETIFVYCKKIELRSDKISLTIDNDKIKQFKVIVINGRKYKLEEE